MTDANRATDRTVLKRLGKSTNSWGVSKETVSLVRLRSDSVVIQVPAHPQRVEMDLKRSALVIVDMQNDFCSTGGWLASIGVDTTPLRSIVEPIRAISTQLRSLGVPVIWLNWGNRSDQANLPPGVLHVYNPDGEGVGIGDELPISGSRVLESGSWSAGPLSGLDPSSSDIWVEKYRMSGFHDTPLDSILRNLDVTTLLFGGVNVDQCVFATLIDAASLGYDIVLLSDCSATTSPEFCVQSTHYNVAQCFGFVATSDDVMTALNKA